MTALHNTECVSERSRLRNLCLFLSWWFLERSLRLNGGRSVGVETEVRTSRVRLIPNDVRLMHIFKSNLK